MAILSGELSVLQQLRLHASEYVLDYTDQGLVFLEDQSVEDVQASLWRLEYI